MFPAGPTVYGNGAISWKKSFMIKRIVFGNDFRHIRHVFPNDTNADNRRDVKLQCEPDPDEPEYDLVVAP